MENAVQIISHEKFGSLRTLLIDGEVLFMGKDSAKSLGFKDTSKAIRTHVAAADKKFIRPSDLKGLRVPANAGLIPTSGAVFINESGLYSLILSSKLPVAQEFKHWVTSEVLPSIRQNGYYISPAVTKLPVEIVKVYAFAMEDGTVKIGQSGNLAERLKTIERETLLNVTCVFAVGVENRQKARDIEAALHKHFAAQCNQGEFFSVDFNAACVQIEKLVGINHAPKDFSAVNCFLKIAELTTDLTLREDCLKTAYELLK